MKFCKTCRFLEKTPSMSDGRAVTATNPANDYYYKCSWQTTITVPWPENSRVIKGYTGMIGKRFVEPDFVTTNPELFNSEPWDETMNCQTWEQK